MYVKETVTAGETIEVRKYHTIKYCRKGQRRGVNTGRTTERQARINRRNAQRTLRQLINANFGGGDIHLVLTYRREERPTAAEAKKKIAVFLRQLRAAYKAAGTELKYIQVPPEHVGGAVHHHLIISGIDARVIRELWPHGGVHPSYLDSTGNYAGLAQYIIKETDRKLARGAEARKKAEAGEDYCGRRWSCSRNLKKPEIKKEIVKADSWREQPVAKEGYIIETDSIETGVNEDGYAEQTYIMRRIRPAKGERGFGLEKGGGSGLKSVPVQKTKRRKPERPNC